MPFALAAATAVTAACLTAVTVRRHRLHPGWYAALIPVTFAALFAAGFHDGTTY